MFLAEKLRSCGHALCFPDCAGGFIWCGVYYKTDLPAKKIEMSMISQIKRRVKRL